MIDLILFDLPIYTALVLLGAVMGLGVAYGYVRQRARRAVTPTIFLDGALVVCAAAWVGARAYHVALNWDYYAARPDEIAQIGLGGLAMRGAFLAGGLALWLYACGRALPIGKLADAAALGLALGQAIGWFGALARGAPYGVVSDQRIALELPDIYGLIAPRFPLPHSEIILFAGLFVGLMIWATRRPRAGLLFWTYVLVAASVNLVLGFWRGDATLYVGVWRFDQIIDALLGALALSVLIWRKVKSQVND